jgi:hypothetical protein
MLEEGNIIYFTPFYFKNGKSAAKPKYFVVLKSDIDSKGVLASLPTRLDSIPTKDIINYGCVELPNIRLNCFVIPNNINVTECGKRFDFTSHIYGHQLDFYDKKLIEEIYPIEGTDYEIWGKMKNEIYKDLIICLKNSTSVKSKFIKIFNQ